MEYMDIVDGNDQVIGSAPIDEIYEKKHLHRIAHIFIFNDKVEMTQEKDVLRKLGESVGRDIGEFMVSPDQSSEARGKM